MASPTPSLLELSMQQGMPALCIFAALFVPLQLVNHFTGNLVGTVAYFVPVVAVVCVLVRHGKLALERQKAKRKRGVGSTRKQGRARCGKVSKASPCNSAISS